MQMAEIEYGSKVLVVLDRGALLKPSLGIFDSDTPFSLAIWAVLQNN